MTLPDARAVLEKMREGEAETLAAIGDRPASWQSVQAMYTARLAALDVALSALALVARLRAVDAYHGQYHCVFCSANIVLGHEPTCLYREARVAFPQEP